MHKQNSREQVRKVIWRSEHRVIRTDQSRRAFWVASGEPLTFLYVSNDSERNDNIVEKRKYILQ